MHAVVVGAGIIGVTTAYYLRQQGADVTVIERHSGVAQETSFGAAGVIAPAYTAPWAQPGMPMKLLAALLLRPSPLVFRPRLDLDLWRWIGRWWRECSVERFRLNKERMQRLALYSLQQLHALSAARGLEYERSVGYLQLFRSDREIERTAPARQLLHDAGVAHRLLDAVGCREREPALAEGAPLAGGLYLPDDEIGNCAYFARRLKEIAERDGVRFRFGLQATGLEIEGGRAVRVRTSQETIAGDRFVIACGADSGPLLARAGVRVPLYPVNGCSATVPIARHEYAPRLAIMDEARKVAITRLGNRLRVAGLAEIGPRKPVVRQRQFDTLIQVARTWFPGAANYADAQLWVGARPMLPDGPPLLGATGIEQLFVNVGHGSSGWAMACGSGRILADVLTGRTPEIDLTGLTLERYLRAA